MEKNSYLLQLGLHTSSGYLDKEACSTMSWCFNIKDINHALFSNEFLAGSNLATTIIDTHQKLVNSCNDSNVKWKCGSHFLFTVLPTMCEWFVQDSTFRSCMHPKHITTTCVTRKFLRYKEWTELQRKKIANIAETQLNMLLKSIINHPRKYCYIHLIKIRI